MSAAELAVSARLQQISVIIIGGGASGVLMAAHLLRSQSASFRLTLVERSEAIAEGVAYSTDLPEHVLNVSVKGMSALADDRSHFERWLGAFSNNKINPASYVARSLYGLYLADLLSHLRAIDDGKRFHTVTDEALDVTETPTGVEVHLGNGTSLIGHIAILATGHEARAAQTSAGSSAAGDAQLPILIVGTGLSMVDTFLAAARRKNHPPVIAISRHGLLPHAHTTAPPIAIDAADIPFGTKLSFLMRWLRVLIAELADQGIDWRSVIDGMRPHCQDIWRSWTPETKRRFLRHARPWWSIHRHRLAPPIHERLTKAVSNGHLAVQAATIVDVADSDGALAVTLRGRKTGEETLLKVARIEDCTGLHFDVTQSRQALLQNLVSRGAVRGDPLAIGLDVTERCAAIDLDGKPSKRLFAIGPITRGTLLEIEGIPNIRDQCAAVAATLSARFAKVEHSTTAES
jgi:uncharacterized NAD(P)/FAD-binding protein YdhS